MRIDLVQTQPLFREDPPSLTVKYTNEETGVNIDIAYQDLVETVLAVEALMGEEEPEQDEEPEPALVEEVLPPASGGGLRVMRSRIPADEL